MKIKNFVWYSVVILSLVAMTTHKMTANSILDTLGFSVTSTNNTNEILVQINGIYYRKVDLSIKDSAGEVLYTERISNRPTYRKRMVMDLPKGNYFLTIEDEKSIQKRTLSMKNGALEIQSPRLSSYTKPTFNKKGKRFLVSMTANTPSAVEVEFIDEAGTSFFKENLIVAKHLERNYDISTLPTGHYKVVLMNREEIYQSDLVVR